MKEIKYVSLMLILLLILGCSTYPDLVVNRLDWDEVNKRAEVEFTNTGNEDAGEFMVYVNGDEFPQSQNRRPQVRHHVSGLTQGTSMTVQAEFAPLAHPDNNNLGNIYKITALVDPKSIVSESDESNNYARTPVIVPPVELYDKNDNPIPENPIPLSDVRLPVLFIHGHNLNDPVDQSHNYKKNWQDPLDYVFFPKLPSFKIAMELPQNLIHNIEPYYIRFVDQNRSITEDALEIGEAVKRILKRHNDPQAVKVKVVIIAYSKGTISSRWYLKNLLPSFRPVSEFIAISPPNHGLAADSSLTGPSLSLRQLNNGFDDNCTSFGEPHSEDFIEILNGHPIEDTITDSVQRVQYRGEAPESRAGSAPAHDGVLYLALYANLNRDAVGGHTPSGDCQGRKLAKTLDPDAESLEVSQIIGFTPPGVHANTVHTPEVICLALFMAVHHQLPPSVLSCNTEEVDNREVPVIP